MDLLQNRFVQNLMHVEEGFNQGLIPFHSSHVFKYM